MYTLTVASVLVGGFNPSEKYESQLGLLLIPSVWKNKKRSKPPTSVHTGKKNHKSTSGYVARKLKRKPKK